MDHSNPAFRNVRQAATASFNQEPQQGHRYFIGVDWGRDDDHTAIAVIDRDTHSMVDIEVLGALGWANQRDRLRYLFNRWQPKVILAESNSIGVVNIEALQQEGLPVIPFALTVKSKQALFDNLAQALDAETLQLLPLSRLIDQLVNATITARGIHLPEGMQQDLILATALALWAARYSGESISFV